MLLYPGHWIAEIFHRSEVTGYYIWLNCQFVLGVGMLWLAVRLLDVPVRFRRLLFILFLAIQLPSVINQGSNYTLFRFNVALCGTLLVQVTWKRTHSSLRTAIVAIFGFALALATSPEEAIGLSFGVFAYLLLLAIWGSPKFHWSALLVCILSAVACSLYVARLGMFAMMQSFSAGGYAYPIMPSPHVLLLLLPYVFAACACWRAFREKDWESPAIPLALAGAAMLPYALGRSDLGHLQLATPAYLLGIAVILGMPSVRRWWLPLMALALVSMYYVPTRDMARGFAHQLRARTTNASVGDVPLHDALLLSHELPCDQTYYSPALILSPREPYRRQCLDFGYNRSLTGLFNARDVERKINEMRARPGMPMLMPNQTLESLSVVGESDPAQMRIVQFSPFLPPRRNAPITFRALTDYIQSHYRPGPVIAEGRARVWYPLSAAPPPMSFDTGRPSTP